MIFKAIGMVIGLIIFIGGLLRFNKEKKGQDIKTRKKYGMITYLGFAISVVFLISLLGNILSEVNTLLVCIAMLVLFSVAGHFFLENETKKK